MSEHEPSERRSTLSLLGRHQAASVVSTAVDFATMTLLVELGWLLPATATFLGAAAGGVTNFTLGRHVFGAMQGGATTLYGQALRYALVSAASAVLNAVGVHLLVHYVGAHYVLGRTAVAIGVSLAWNFPMQRRFVFRDGIKPLAPSDETDVAA